MRNLRVFREKERGGAMIWLAVLMMAVPPMLWVLVNSVRLARAAVHTRTATSAACEAAADAAVDLAHYRQTGEVVLRADVAQSVASTYWRRAVAAERSTQGVSMTTTVQGSSLLCQSVAVYLFWGRWASQWPLWLGYTAISQPRLDTR